VARRNSANPVKLNLLGPELRRFRIAADLTQEQLAARFQVRGWNVTQDMVARFENQQRTLTDRELFRFLDVLNIPISHIKTPAELWKM